MLNLPLPSSLNSSHILSGLWLVVSRDLSTTINKNFTIISQALRHWAWFPWQSIAYCLREARLRLADDDHVAINQDGCAHRMHKIRGSY
jgi:hypothetical protein